jgi:hypothetical protein
MNKRADIPLVKKHNDALLLLPTILSENGFQVTVTNPSWANHSWISDITIYKGLKNVTAMNTIGHYTNLWFQLHGGAEPDRASRDIKAHIFRFSLFKVLPVAFRRLSYDDGDYWGLKNDWLRSGGDTNELLIDNYAPLDFLPELTTFDADTSSALLITNELTHTAHAFALAPPDYTPVPVGTVKAEGLQAQNGYEANAAMFHRVGEWLSVLKEAGVYDNTRIIIVSDHGAGLSGEANKNFIIGGDAHYEKFNPVLFVKDFNSHGPIQFDRTFMTNGDTPQIALKGIIDDPKDPFTGKKLAGNWKMDGVTITTNDAVMPYMHGKNTFTIPDNEWLHVRGDIFNPDNWKKVMPDD